MPTPTVRVRERMVLKLAPLLAVVFLLTGHGEEEETPSSPFLSRMLGLRDYNAVWFGSTLCLRIGGEVQRQQAEGAADAGGLRRAAEVRGGGAE